MKKTLCKANSVWRMAMIFIVTMLLFAFVLPTDCIAKAEDYDWQKGYEDYIGALDDDDKKDWYFGDDHLDIDGALAVLGGFFADENFDKEALKADPIIIGIIDSGIGFGYTLEDGEEKTVGSEYVYSSDVDYKLHPIFEDVLLKDADGKYIYKNVADKVSIVSNKDEDRDGKKDILTTMTSVDDGGVVVTASGNIALDMVDNTSDDHGTHVTGTVAMLIHKLGLEDYIKILPVKANTTLHYSVSSNGAIRYTAGYNINYLNTAMDFCRENRADIVSLSLTAYNQSEDSGYMFADYVDDMLIVAAAGNNGEKVKGYPAYADNVLGVMNHTVNEAGNPVLADSSNHGQSISGKYYYDISAPGTGIISSINGDEYGKLTGTSMATPITAFATALGYLRYRGYNNYDYGYALSPLSVSTMISHGVSKMATKKEGLLTYAYPVLSLTHILTYDFYGDVEFLEKIGEVQEEGETIREIDIIDIAKSQYKIGSKETLTLIANPVPANATKVDTLQWWLVYDGEERLLGEGWTLEWKIPDVVGKYTIYCKTIDENGEVKIISNDTVEFSVVYRTPEELKIAHNNTEYAIGETYTFYIPTEHINPNVAVEIVWYVNGQKAGEGKELNFTPEELGDYTITATVNGIQIDQVNITSYTENGWVLLFALALMLASAFMGIKALWITAIVKIAIDVTVCTTLLIIYGVKKHKSKKETTII